MKIKDYKCKCGHNDFFFTDKGNQKGIYCSYCGKWVKWADKDEQNLTMKQDPCDDAISRESVIEWLKDKDIIKTKNQEENAKRELAELPSVQPTRPTGRWINLENTKYKGQVLPFWGRYGCSKCGGHGEGTFNYCPNCGAKMKAKEAKADDSN